MGNVMVRRRAGVGEVKRKDLEGRVLKASVWTGRVGWAAQVPAVGTASRKENLGAVQNRRRVSNKNNGHPLLL